MHTLGVPCRKLSRGMQTVSITSRGKQDHTATLSIGPSFPGCRRFPGVSIMQLLLSCQLLLRSHGDLKDPRILYKGKIYTFTPI